MSSPSTTIATAPASLLCTTVSTTLPVAITPSSTPVSFSQISPSSPKSQRIRSLSRSRLFTDDHTSESILNTSSDSNTIEFSSIASEFSSVLLSTTTQSPSPSPISVTSTSISSNLPTSSAPLTTPTSSLMDSYFAMMLLSPSSPSSSPCVTTTTTFVAGQCVPSTISSSEPDILSILSSQLPASSPLQHEPIPENPNVPLIAVDSDVILPNPHVSAPASSTSLPHINNHIPSYEFPAIPLRRKKLMPSESASNDTSVCEPDPLGLQHILTFLVNKVDCLLNRTN